MNQLKQQIKVTLERLDQYAHREDFDLYDFEEIIFKEFQEVHLRDRVMVGYLQS